MANFFSQTVASPPGQPVPEGFLTGQLLIAMPALADPRFQQSVIYVCAHTPEGAMALTASLDVLKVIAEGGGPRECVLALGYAGWGPGQLDQEIQANSWLSAPADETLLFDGQHDTKWRRAFAKLRVDPLLLSDTAGHA